jgi:hypothetical protein
VKKCPQCGNEIFCLDPYCPHCKYRLERHFTVKTFLKENFQYFVIIGVIGTMISLLPNLGTSAFGPNWVSNNELGQFSLSLLIIIFFGGLFIVSIIFVIIDKIAENRSNEDEKHFLKVIPYREGDIQRFLLFICLFPMAIGFAFFIFPYVMYIPNINAIYGFLLVVSLIIIAYLSVSVWVIKKQVQSIDEFSSHFGKHRLTVFTLGVLIFLLLILYILFSFPPQTIIPHPYTNETIEIGADQKYYSPLFSQNRGLLLSVTNITPDQISHTKCHWSTNYGYFVSHTLSGAPDQILGSEFDSNTRPVFWTYPTEDIQQQKNPVTIRLVISNSEDNSSVIKETSLNLTWFTKDIVFINKSYPG